MRVRAAVTLLALATALAGPGCRAAEEAETDRAAPAPAPAPAVEELPPAEPAAHAADAATNTSFTGEEWREASPESVGLDPERLARGVERVGELAGMRSLLVVRHGRIVAERSYAGAGRNRSPHDVKSASKSLLSALVGIAIERGEIPGVDATVGELLPDYAEGLAPEKRGITLEQLLSMSSGLASTSGEHYGAWVASGDWARGALARPLEEDAGDGFGYSTGSSHLVSAILTEATGRTALDYAREHLAGPLGITIHSWQGSPEGYSFGGNSVRMTPRDLARLGQLYLQEGRWNGRQVVPAEWVRRSTRRHAEGWPHRYGAYGYLWWLPPDDPWESFAAVGYGGQFLYVVPELDMLLVTTATIESKGEEWDREAFAIFRDDVFSAARERPRERPSGR